MRLHSQLRVAGIAPTSGWLRRGEAHKYGTLSSPREILSRFGQTRISSAADKRDQQLPVSIQCPRQTMSRSTPFSASGGK